MIEIPDVHPIDIQVATLGWHCWYCADDPVLEAAHRAAEEEQFYGIMPTEEHTYHLTLSFDCDHPGHAKMIADYIVAEMRKRIPQQLDATFEVR